MDQNKLTWSPFHKLHMMNAAAQFSSTMATMVTAGLPIVKALEVTANVVVLAGEGMVLAVCQVFPVKFAAGKVGFDVTLVLLATALSFLFLGHLEGVREGTVVAAICVGMVVKLVNKPLGRFAEKYLS